jgi:hypothetical protein
MFRCGELVEVSDDGKHWLKRIFVEYRPNAPFPYICVYRDDKTKFYSRKKYRTMCWRYARKIEGGG